MSVNVVRAKREKELLQKGKYFNPFQLEYEHEISTLKKQEASKDEKILRDQFLKSMKKDIDHVYERKENEKRTDLIQGEKMIELDKSFVEERRRKEKEKMENFQKEAMKDYKNYYAKKDENRFYHKRTQTEDRDKLSLRLKPDERFFKYQERYFKNSIQEPTSKERSENQKELNNQNKYQTTGEAKSSTMDSKNNEYYNVKSMTIDKTQKPQFKGLIYPYAISTVQDDKENNRYFQKEKSKSLSKVYQSEDFSSKSRGGLSLNKNGSNYLYLRQVRLEEEYKKMINPYSQKKLNIGDSWIKDNPLIFNEVPYTNNKTDNSHSSLKNAGTSVIQKN